MENYNLYQDIQTRTGGEIYVGIVGPVRTGKSTFVRKFMEQLVLPQMSEQERERTRDEVPASASGRTVTTVEPKFIPREAAQLTLDETIPVKLRLVDCVGFPVHGAEGLEEDGSPRMVHTPWQAEPIPFAEAARLGTRKVITDHATIGIVLTTDGSFGELGRSSFLEAEKETIELLKKLGKPFLVVLNSANPYAQETQKLADSIRSTYAVTCVIQNCLQLGVGEIQNLFGQLLLEFPLVRVVFRVPKWTETLENTHWLKQELFEKVRSLMKNLYTVRDIQESDLSFDCACVKQVRLGAIDLSRGDAEVNVEIQDTLYYEILSEMTGTQIQSEYQLISIVREMAHLKQEYESVSDALTQVRQTGYGILVPQKEEIQMEEPAVIRQGSRFGVKIRANAPSIHLIRADIETEIAPIVGSEAQAMDLITYIKESSQQETGEGKAQIFGKSIDQMIEEGIQTKLSGFSEESRRKLQHAMKRIMNDSGRRLICIII